MNVADQQLSKTLRSVAFNLELASHNLLTALAFVEDAAIADLMSADADRLAAGVQAMQNLLREVSEGRICRHEPVALHRRA
ncbi:MAG: hypothetical protein GAK45_00371 [Pseudomonas citronellolis]|nr:MAG: hypothetical protein GAK45_00371 [Pseudomonas citronellolis]